MRLIARFANDLGERFEIIDVFDKKIERTQMDKATPIISTLTQKYPSAIWMERKIRDEFGITFKGAFDERYLVKHERFPKNIFPLRKDFNLKEIAFTPFEPYDYEEVSGDSVYVVPVGPIHAGIIEPGHFQFSQAGEEILHLEVRHFYKYRAIEKMCEKKPLLEIKKIVERISGNATIAYQIAFYDILAQATVSTLPNSLKRKYATLLELERLTHHLTDLGFIPNDAGFSPALAFMSKLSEDCKRVMEQLVGHRFGFGAIKEELTLDYTILEKFLVELKSEILFFRDWMEHIPSLWDRFDNTGKITQENGVRYGAVGVVARASGLKLDRRDNDFYKDIGFKMALGQRGEVSDRFKVRIEEILNSIEMINNLKTNLNETFEYGEVVDGEYMSFVESSIGELFMYIKIEDKLVHRFYVRDASSINWQLFHTSIYKDIIADFPLINKSFDLSYAGNDL